jgi:hypothetical protein
MAASPTDEAERLFAELCERIPDVRARAAMIGVPVELDQAWRGGRQLPILRAHRKALAAAVAGLERG